jgi:glyoxylate/hydroxypyruvate reductase
MNIAISHTHEQSAFRWQEEIARLIPQAIVKQHHEIIEGWATYAIGWQPSAKFFDTQRNLKVFFSAAAGVDHLLSNPSLPSDLPIIRLEDAGMGLQMAEYCCLEVGRQFHRRDDYLVQQRSQKWGFLKSEKRSEFVVGIFGAGVLAQEIVKGLNYFGYRTQTFSRSSKQSLDEFLGSSKILILCAPLTALTQDFFNTERLQKLPKGAYLINVARGGLVVDDDLLAAIDSGHVSGASLDVFREEPLPVLPVVHRFWQHPKIRMTPHVSAVTLIGPSSKQVALKLMRVDMGQSVSGIVDRSKGY